jgi:dihydroxyacetone kinase
MSEAALGQAEQIVRVIAQTSVDNEKYFCELDAVVGDGDFGYSLARGFEIVLSDWDRMQYTDVAGLLKKTAMVLSKRIGGTSGPIWGTAFLRAGGALNDVAAPSGDQVIAALRAAIEGIKQRGSADLGDKTLLDALVPAAKGVLHIINNYTGDRMAFDMGRELSEVDGIKVATLVVDDDVAVKDSTYTVGRRGVAGNFFVIKAVGAAAEKGAELEDLVKLGERVNAVTRTMGMALTSCTPPREGLADVRPRRRRDGDGRRDPRRARQAAREARERQRHHRRAARGCRVGSSVLVG